MIPVTKNMNVRDQFFLTGAATASGAIAGIAAMRSPLGGALCGLARCVVHLSLSYIDPWVASLFSDTRAARVASVVIGLATGILIALGIFYLMQMGAITIQGDVLKFVVLNLVTDIGIMNIMRAMNWVPATA